MSTPLRIADPALLEESAEDLYDNAPCGYVSALPDGTLVKLNQTFLTWTGYQREDLVGRKRFQNLLTAGGRIFHETHYAPLLRMQGAVREIAVDIVCADGRRLPVLINSVLKQDAAGKPLLIRTTVFNATDRREYERELLRERQKAEQATLSKTEFISTLSHEIRNPINSIQGIAYLLERGGPLSPQQMELLQLLRRSAENLLSLVNDILDFGKIEAGKSSLEERSFDLRQLVNGVVQPLRIQTEAKGLDLVVHVDDRVPAQLLGDPIKIGQVLTNLLGNAIKFTESGLVALMLRVQESLPDATSIEFQVLDTGIGIAPDQLAHIFDDYTQAHLDIGPKYGGTGLGLAISKKLVELQGGQITVDSEPGRGTTFSFVLRLKVPRG